MQPQPPQVPGFRKHRKPSIVGDIGHGVEFRREREAGDLYQRVQLIGRAAMGYPWVFREARQYLETGATPAST